ncbi:MAG: TetR/AcrR family transcriptional regulator [Desulfurivibrio sp.]|nr:TetR/AcrR family transcriptional regulator [Desulfurivibrio sp.]MBU3936961.1 TetR/AcrR family transcriptional regulator [Pseudomonadota bacterium]MBU4117863.1 TetR/AcrR family transcriptional regulator [Pseudomonadota bacterium]
MPATIKGEQTREHILKTSRKILVAQGFHNTSVSEIVSATGVKKGNLYYYFASKEELGLAVLEDAKVEFFLFLDKALSGPDPVAKVVNSCQAIFNIQKKNNFVGGCLFGNTALEMTDSNPEFAAVIQEVFDLWTKRLEDLLLAAQKSGRLNSPIPPRLLAKTVVATVEGALMMSRVSKREKDLRDFLAAVKSLLGA